MTKRLLVVTCLISLWVLSGCDHESVYNDNEPTYETYNGDRWVKYQVTGTAPSVDVTLSNRTEDTEQYTDQPLPYAYEFACYVGPDSWDYQFVYISAQNQSDSGTVTSTIYFKKKETDSWTVSKTASSSGAYVIATASGALE